MPDTKPAPAGAKLDILNLLLKQELSSQNLAAMLGVSPAAVRQHLNTLEALGLVMRRRVVTSPNRPTYLYRVSADGMRVLPKRYDLLLVSVIDALIEQDGPQEMEKIVGDAAHRVAARGRDRFRSQDGQRRWELMLEWLEQEFAWQADVEVEASGARRITIHQCPFQDLPRSPVDVCGVFFTTLIRALDGDAPVEHATATKTPACCAFVVSRGQ
jgi:DeoR family suf operon transcriptional repressor